MRAGGNALMTSLGGTAGRLIRDEGTTGYATVVHDTAGIVKEIRRQIKYGADWIKVMVTGLIPTMKGPEVQVWKFDEIKAVCDTAHELNTKVVGHCRKADGPEADQQDHGDDQHAKRDQRGQSGDEHELRRAQVGGDDDVIVDHATGAPPDQRKRERVQEFVRRADDPLKLLTHR